MKRKELLILALALPVATLFIWVPLLSHYHARVTNKDAIEEFYSIELYSPSDNADNRTVDNGDGITSKASLQLERRLSIKASGREAETKLTNNLKNRSMTVVEKKYAQRCSVDEVEAYYKVVDARGRDFTVNIGSKIESMSSGCPYYTISQDVFYSKNVTFLFARLYIR